MFSFQSITQLCLRIIAGDSFHEEGAPSAHPTTVLHANPPPPSFCNAVLRMTTILMQALGHASFSLEMVSGAEGLGGAADRIEAVLCHLLIPLFLRTAAYPKGSLFRSIKVHINDDIDCLALKRTEKCELYDILKLSLITLIIARPEQITSKVFIVLQATKRKGLGLAYSQLDFRATPKLIEDLFISGFE
uniref:UNC80_C domain-containing protein n=1 Tax=Angiostrongylus cantonensis TaxID=6313 RepID=A0A0K0DBW0_ANGCA